MMARQAGGLAAAATVLMVAAGLLTPRLSAANDSMMRATLEPAEDGRWRIAYRTTPAVSSLVFYRGNGDYRRGTWSLEDEDFVIERLGGTDRIRRRDNETFAEVAASVTPTTEKPRADYTPFIPFTDGGMAVYTGQFVVGVPLADDDEAFALGLDSDNAGAFVDAAITVKPGSFGRMIVDARVSNEEQRLPFDDGEYVYYGGASAVETATLTAVTDSAVPAWLREFLYDSMARTYDYFTYRLGEIRGAKPFLIAAFRPLAGGQVSFSGGVVDSQLVVDLGLGSDVPDVPEARQLMVNFFAHESAHLWHKGGGVRAGASGSWMHEGGADAKAWLALVELDIYGDDVARGLFEEAANECASHLDDGSLTDVMERAAFDAYYDCGATIALATHGAMRGVGRDLFDFWRRLLKSEPDANDFRVDYYYFEAGRIVPGLDSLLYDFAEGRHENGTTAVYDLLVAGAVDVELGSDDRLTIRELP